MNASAHRIWLDAKLDAETQKLIPAGAVLCGPGAGGAAGSLDGIETAEGVVAGSRVQWNEALFRRAARVRVVARAGIGCDNVDVAAATAAGVCVANTPEAPTESTAEFTVAAMLALARRLCVADRRFRAEGWVEGADMLGVDLTGRTLGLVGIGRIGTRVAEMARAIGMKVVGCDPALDAAAARARGVELLPDLDAVLVAADVVSLHLPLLPATRGLIDARRLARMKRGAMLINAARGPILDGAALAEALKSGHLFGAAVDVWDVEPMTGPHPLRGLENVIATPHIANSTIEGRRRNQTGAVQAVLAVLAGRRPASLVNPEVWDRRRSAV